MIDSTSCHFGRGCTVSKTTAVVTKYEEPKAKGGTPQTGRTKKYATTSAKQYHRNLRFRAVLAKNVCD